MLDKIELLTLVTDAIIEVKPEASEKVIGLDTPLYLTEEPCENSPDLGFDSLDALDLVTLLEEKLDLRLTGDVDLSSVRTVANVIDTILICAASAEAASA